MLHLLAPLALCPGLLQDPPPLRPDPPPDDRFEKRVLLRGLARPMELEVAPDGTVFLIELAGRVSVFEPATGLQRTVLEVDVFPEQENGLLGLALDPDFERTGWVYLLYSPPDLVGQRLARFDWDGQALLGEVVLLEFEEQRRECCHHAGSMEFASDGCLFISTGDNTHPHGDSQGYAPIDEREERFPWDAQRSSANTAVLGGKVLRVRPTPEGGIEIPDGNLFPGGEGGRAEIYAMGCRNPWRIGVDQKTGYLYWGEVGPDAHGDGARGPRGYDEVNQARSAGNFGWPLFIADNQAYAWVDFETGSVGGRFDPERPVNRSVNNTGARVLPPAQPAWIYYPYGASAEFPQLDAPGGRSACAGPVYDHDPSSPSKTKLPAWFDRALFIYEWSRHWIMVVHLTPESDIASISPLPGGFEFKRPVDIDIAPDGTLYVLEYGSTWQDNTDSALVRIDYHAGNRPPRAQAAVSPSAGAGPLRVTLSAEGSIDLDGDQLSYSWRDASGAHLGGGEVLQVELPDDGRGWQTLEVEVTDPSGASARSSVGVLVGNTPPQVQIGGLRDGGFYDPGEELSWTLAVRDPEDGQPGDGDPEWWYRQTSLHARFVEGPPPGEGIDEAHPAVARMRKSDCFNCHAVERRVVGPAFLEIADRYRGDGEALERAVQRVHEGSAEVWGSQPMLPHPDLAPEALREMVGWVLSLDDEAPPARQEQGFNGRIPTDQATTGTWILEAEFEDSGPVAWDGPQEATPRLKGHDRVVVRTRRVEGEHASSRKGTKILSSETASAGAFIGDIHPGQHLRFEGVDLHGVSSVRLSVSSAGAGGRVDLRSGAANGPVLATYEVVANGAWEEWFQLEQAMAPPSGKADLYVCFEQLEKGGALMNLDWLEFGGPEASSGEDSGSGR